MDRVIVFVGPSLPPPRPTAEQIEFRPPARRGELLAAAREGVSAIALIDGEIFQSLAVTPREVRAAQGLGPQLFGAASLGALRACECPQAMTGIGRIYEAFRDGALLADDEVVGTFLPHNYETISYPLVIIREALRLLLEKTPALEGAARAFFSQLQELPFDKRDDSHIIAVASPILGIDASQQLLQIVQSPEADVKRCDALMLLELLGCEPDPPCPQSDARAPIWI